MDALLNPIDLVKAYPWQRTTFTTYALSLSFFEAVVLDAIERGRGRPEILILADIEGVRASISEQGAHLVGKEYQVEPVAVSNGVFHPKISVFTAADQCHLLVGSGNLTFGGWGGNCEVLEHLHSGNAPDAIADAASFFERLADCNRVRHGVAVHCGAIAADLRRCVIGTVANPNLRLLHNLDHSIIEQLAEAVTDLGGAKRLVAAAPFWDGAMAIDSLCKALGLSEVFIHSHPHGSITEMRGRSWPHDAKTTVYPVRLAVMGSEDEAARPLHAKIFEILCKRGRLVVSGSANGTTAALGSGRNIEACVLRIQRDSIAGWQYADGQLPSWPVKTETGEEEATKSGVLRAILEADELTGQILTPRMSGLVSIYHLGTDGARLLASTQLGLHGKFVVPAPQLEALAMLGGRLVIRAEDEHGRRSEGYLYVAGLAEVMRRTGKIGRSLLALTAGSETPRDIAAIMSFFHEHPEQLLSTRGEIKGAIHRERLNASDTQVPVVSLTTDYTSMFATTKASGQSANSNWSRFIEHILTAFRGSRGPVEAARHVDEEDNDGDMQNTDSRSAEDPQIAGSFLSFTKLLGILTNERVSQHSVVIGFDLSQYVCDRLRPDAAQARTWFEQLIRAFMDVGVEPGRLNDVAAAVLVLLGVSPEITKVRSARGVLLRLGVDLLDGLPPTADGVKRLQTILQPQATFAELWEKLCSVRTLSEQVDSYKGALENGEPSNDYPDLRTEAHEEWPVLEAALTSLHARQRLMIEDVDDACPRCNIQLPGGEVRKLRAVGIATAKNCCQRVVIAKAT